MNDYSCHLCGAPLSQPYDIWKSGGLFCCQYCGWVSTLPLHEARVLQSRLFDGDKWHTYYSHLMKEKNPSQMHCLLARYLKKWTRGRTLLEVGCGPGQFLLAARKEGWRTLGVEKSARFVGLVRAKHEDLHIIGGDIHSVSLHENQYSAIAMFDVLAHLEDPKAILRKLRTSLKQNGVLLLQTGVYHDEPPGPSEMDVPNHFHAYTYEALLRLLVATGYTVRKTDWLFPNAGWKLKTGMATALLAPEGTRQVLQVVEKKVFGPKKCTSVWLWCRKY